MTLSARTAFRSLNAAVIPVLDSGFGNPAPIGIGPVVVETTGRTSGKPRRVPLLSLRFGDHVFVATVRPGSQWAANLAASPAASVRLFGTDRPATAQVTRAMSSRLQIASLRLADAL